MRYLYFYLCFSFFSIQSNGQDNLSVKHQAFKKDINYLPKDIASHIPSGYTAIDTVFGDLNRDQYKDLLLVLKRNGEDTTYDEYKRPLLLLLGQKDKKTYKLVAKNENVIYCISCGGAMGDPYIGAKIWKGDFAINHFGGSGQRWGETLTFRFSPKDRKWYLHKIATYSFDIAKPDKEEAWKIKTKNHFGKVSFESYAIQDN